MAQVNFRDAVTYGFNLLGYLVILGLTTGLLSLIGAWLTGTGGQPIFRLVLGALFSAAAMLVFAAGMMGLTYKIIADAVKRGTRS